MSLAIGTVRKSLMKSVVSAKTAKLGLKVTSKDTTRTAIAHQAVSLKESMGHILSAFERYILGFQITPQIKTDALDPMGDFGANLVILARFLKVKTPTASKKVRLAGTTTAGLLRLDNITTKILGLAEKSLFSEPKMRIVNKIVNMPNSKQATEGGVLKEQRDIKVLDLQAEKDAELSREKELAKLTEEAIDLYWRLCFSIYNQPPSFVLAHKLSRLAQESTEGDTPNPGVEVAEKELAQTA